MSKKNKVAKKLKIKKLNYIKELNYTVDVVAGGCGYNFGCSHAA